MVQSKFDAFFILESQGSCHCMCFANEVLISGQCLNLKHAKFWLILTFMWNLTIQNSQREKSKRKKKEQAFNWKRCSDSAVLLFFLPLTHPFQWAHWHKVTRQPPPFCMSSLFCPSILPLLSFLSTSLSLCLFLIFLYCLPLPPFFLSLVRVVFVWRTSSLWVFLLPLMIRSCDGKQELPCFRLLWGKPETESRLYHFS